MLTIQDLQGSARRRRRERMMRLVFQGAAVASIVISAAHRVRPRPRHDRLLPRDRLGLRAAQRHRLVPPADALRPAHDLRRERGDGQRGDARRGAVRPRHRDLPLRVRPAPSAQVRQADRRDPRRHPLGDRRASSSSTSSLPTWSTRSSASRRATRRCSPPASASGSSSSRSWPRSRRTPSARCPTRCARRATAAAPARSAPRSVSCCPPPCPASSPRSSSPSRARSARRW